MVQAVLIGEPQLSAQRLDQSVPWHIIQRFYAKFPHFFNDDLFEPHISRNDMTWQSVERSLAKIEPSLAFWESTHYFGILHEGKAVSMNLVDAALNYCNTVPFQQRIQQQFQKSLWHELLIKYLQPSTVEQAVVAQLQPEYANQPIMA